MYLLDFRLSCINRKPSSKVVPTELASIVIYFTDKTKVCIYAILSTLSHDLHYRALSCAVQISNQNMYTNCHCVEISIQELFKTLHS